MTNETQAQQPIYIVTRIGFGTKLHLSVDYNSGRLYPACGSDSPFSKARKTSYEFKHITCAKCFKKAKDLGLLPAE